MSEKLTAKVIQVFDNKELYRGALVKPDGTVVWECDHNHSIKELNRRWQNNPQQVWEYSALNCARHAIRQGPTSRKGIHGHIEFDQDPLLRDDVKFIKVDDHSTYKCRVYRDDNGDKVLRVQLIDRDDPGFVTLSGSKTVVSVVPSSSASTDGDERVRWATAVHTALEHLRGMVFQEPDATDSVASDPTFATRHITSKKTWNTSRARSSRSRAVKTPEKKEESQEEQQDEVKPHIEANFRHGKRTYDVVGVDGSVVETFYHRGKAVDKLTKLRR